MIASESFSSTAFENAVNQSWVTFLISKSGGTVALRLVREGNSQSGTSVLDTIVGVKKEWTVDKVLVSCDDFSLFPRAKILKKPWELLQTKENHTNCHNIMQIQIQVRACIVRVMISFGLVFFRIPQAADQSEYDRVQQQYGKVGRLYGKQTMNTDNLKMKKERQTWHNPRRCVDAYDVSIVIDSSSLIQWSLTNGRHVRARDLVYYSQHL